VARRPAVETDPGLRASDADREQVVSRLREHVEPAVRRRRIADVDSNVFSYLEKVGLDVEATRAGCGRKLGVRLAVPQGRPADKMGVIVWGCPR
jgi:hypothetical protein